MVCCKNCSDYKGEGRNREEEEQGRDREERETRGEGWRVWLRRQYLSFSKDFPHCWRIWGLSPGNKSFHRNSTIILNNCGVFKLLFIIIYSLVCFSDWLSSFLSAVPSKGIETKRDGETTWPWSSLKLCTVLEKFLLLPSKYICNYCNYIVHVREKNPGLLLNIKFWTLSLSMFLGCPGRTSFLCGQLVHLDLFPRSCDTSFNASLYLFSLSHYKH